MLVSVCYLLTKRQREGVKYVDSYGTTSYYYRKGDVWYVSPRKFSSFKGIALYGAEVEPGLIAVDISCAALFRFLEMY